MDILKIGIRLFQNTPNTPNQNTLYFKIRIHPTKIRLAKSKIRSYLIRNWNWKFTVARVIRKSVSCVTDSTSGELFMMVLTRARGRLEFPDAEDDILSQLLALSSGTIENSKLQNILMFLLTIVNVIEIYDWQLSQLIEFVTEWPGVSRKKSPDLL